MLSRIILNLFFAEFHSIRTILVGVILLNAIMQSVILLNVAVPAASVSAISGINKN
jgi:hypothetical protein